MKDGGGEEVWKWQKWATRPCIDRSSICCRPVGKSAGADPKEKRERGKGKGKPKNFGAEVLYDLLGLKLGIYMG